MLCRFLSLNLLEFCHIYCSCILSFSLFITGPIDPRGTLPTGFPTGPGTGGRFVVPSLGGRYPSFCALLKLFSNINNCILFSFFLIVSHWCSVLFNKCICFNLYLLCLSFKLFPTCLLLWNPFSYAFLLYSNSTHTNGFLIYPNV